MSYTCHRKVFDTIAEARFYAMNATINDKHRVSSVADIYFVKDKGGRLGIETYRQGRWEPYTAPVGG